MLFAINRHYLRHTKISVPDFINVAYRLDYTLQASSSHERRSPFGGRDSVFVLLHALFIFSACRYPRNTNQPSLHVLSSSLLRYQGSKYSIRLGADFHHQTKRVFAVGNSGGPEVDFHVQKYRVFTFPTGVDVRLIFTPENMMYFRLPTGAYFQHKYTAFLPLIMGGF